MKKTFNITGRCFPNEHFMADVSGKFRQALDFIESKKYFSINRPRQFGKTTTLLELTQTLKKSGNYLVFLMSLEGTDDLMFDDQKSFSAGFIRLLAKSLRATHADIAEELYEAIETLNSFDDLSDFITNFVTKVQKSVVVLIDEVDHSTNFDVFMRFLGMLRNKYLIRDLEATFHSVVLAGLHDIKSLKSRIRNEQDKQYNSPWNIATDFNVKMEFSESEIIPMLQDFAKERQVTVDTEGVAKQLVFYTSGYPFLVSKLCKIFDEEILPYKNEKIWTIKDVDNATQMLLRGNYNTNFESLIKHLQEDPELYQTVYRMLIYAEFIDYNIYNTTIHKGIIHGIFKRDNGIKIHNRIYESLIYHYMITDGQIKQLMLTSYTTSPHFKKADNSLNIDLILQKFELFMREQRDSKDWDFIEREGRLVFLAFLRPILNGSGYDFKEVQISEERRLDIVITYFQYRYVIELKIWRGQKAHEDGLEQLDKYLDNLGLTEGYILIFDHNKKKRKKSQWINYNVKKLSQTFV